jgi:ABC-2 type transport system ATP-binding protein
VTAAVELSGLVKRYGNVTAVDGVDLRVEPGEVVAFLGPNGAGKTTTLEVLEGFRTRDAGDVRIFGNLDPADRSDLAQIRRRVGIVLQDAHGHYRFLTVRETLAMHRGYHAEPRGIEEVLDLVELTDAADRQVRTLSGGQARRLDVAVALIGTPELIFLDEPTTGFDPAARRRMWELVSRLRTYGTSVLLTTHYMEEAQALADRVAVIVGGRIVGEGTPDTLAQQLNLRSTITCVTGVADQLAFVCEGHGDVELGAGDRFTLTTDEPVAALAKMCEWAQANDVTLTALEVRPPSLEDSYLALTSERGNIAEHERPVVS